MFTRARVPIAHAALLLLLVVAACAALARPAAAAEPGMVSDLTWGLSRADMDRSIDQMAAANAKWIRVNVSWKAGEQWGKGKFNEGYLGNVDYAIDRARAAGLQIIMPIADDVPFWASADPAKHLGPDGSQRWNIRYKPANFGDFADFAAYAANRYKGRGVHVYEVWNEPNLSRFWPSGVNAGEYVQMLKAAYPAIKAADPESTVVSGGISSNDWRYVEQMYAAGAGAYLDALGVHPYSGDPDTCWNDAGTNRRSRYAFCALDELRNIMVAHGDGAKPMYATEFGWSTCDNNSPLCLSSGYSEGQQADYLKKAYARLAERYSYVKVALVYTFRNNYWQNNDPLDWEANLGLVRTDFTPKPAFNAFKDVAANSQAPAAPAPVAPPAPATTTTTTGTGTTTGTTTGLKRPKGKRARAAAVSLAVRRRRAARRRGASRPRVTARGRIVGASARKVRVRIQQRSVRGWSRGASRMVTVRGNRFRLGLIGFRGARLRLRAEIPGTHARSRFVHVALS